MTETLSNTATSLQTSATVKASIAKIKTQTGTLRANIQAALIQCAGHMFAHGDATLFEGLLAAVKSTTNNKHMLAWIKTHGLTNVSKEGLVSKNKPAWKAARDEFATVDAFLFWLEAVEMWDTKPEGGSKAAKPLDATEVVNGLAKRMRKAIEDGDQLAPCDLKAAHAALQSLAGAVMEVHAAVGSPVEAVPVDHLAALATKAA